MKFLKIEDEIKFSQKMFKLKREIENFLCEEGYLNIEPSLLEEYDEFRDIYSKMDKKKTVKLVDNASDILILTPDITAGIVNKFMSKWEENLKLKLFYYGKTYAHNSVEIKEKRQMGVECLGEKNKNTDENVLGTAIKVLNKYSKNYLFEIGSSKFLKGLMQSCSFNKEDYINILNLIYFKNKQELKEYLSKLPYKEAMSTLLNIFDLEGSFEEIIKNLNGLYMNDLMKEGIAELSKVNEYFKNESNKIIYDLSLVSELNYYDGIIFRGYIEHSNKEMIKGGRYDSFTEQFGFKIPAIGFSIELDELIKTLYKEVI
ncbi:MAG: hisZ [Bacillota bacterium]|nr:hisZ [Bacillota bacterium]